MKVTILVRCLNEVENLKKLFPLIEKQTFKNVEIVFIDSGSTDGSYDFVKNYSSKIQIILSKIEKSKFSFGRSLNMAANESTYKDILISLSAHCFPTNENWLYSMITNFENEKIKIVYGKQLGDTRSWLSEASHLNMWFGDESSYKDSSFVNNGNCAFTYDTWSKLKFNEDLTGCEDIDFAQRVINGGGLIFYSSESEVTHYHDENKKQIRNRYRREAQAIKYIYSDSITFSLFNLINNTINEIKLDLKYRKNNSYNFSSLFNIFVYRYNKNLGHFLGINYPIKSNENIKKKYYLYEEDRKNVEYFKKDYFYK